jgi:hypothetical protein
MNGIMITYEKPTKGPRRNPAPKGESIQTAAPNWGFCCDCNIGIAPAEKNIIRQNGSVLHWNCIRSRLLEAGIMDGITFPINEENLKTCFSKLFTRAANLPLLKGGKESMRTIAKIMTDFYKQPFTFRVLIHNKKVA